MSGLLQGAPLDAFPEVKTVVPGIGMDAPVRKFGNGGHHPIQEIAVVGDDDHGPLVAFQMILQPVDTFDVEVIGRLVEKQVVGLPQQQPGQHSPHAPSAGEGFYGAFQIVGGKSETGENNFRPRAGQMGLVHSQRRMDAVQRVEFIGVIRPLVLLQCIQVGDKPRLLGLKFPEVRKPLQRLVDNGRFGIQRLHILFEVPDGRARTNGKPPFVRLDMPLDEPEHRGFSRSVLPDQADPFSGRNAPRQPVEEHLIAETERYVVELDHGELNAPYSQKAEWVWAHIAFEQEKRAGRAEVI